jgi:hypothetical protein
MGGCRKLHKEELRDLYSSTSITRIMKSKMWWEGHVARMGQKRNVCKISGFHGGAYEEWHLLGCYAVLLLQEPHGITSQKISFFRNLCRLLIGKPEGKRLLERPRRRWWCGLDWSGSG